MKKSFRSVPAFTLCALLLGTGTLAQAQLKQVQTRRLDKIQPEISLEEKLRVGGSQHEIVTVLIEGGRFREGRISFPGDS